MKPMIRSLAAFLALGTALSQALAHVSLEQTSAQVGTVYKAVLLVGHGCDGAATTRISVRVPADFAAAQPIPKPGWNATAEAGSITWSAAGKNAALPSSQRGEFAWTGTLPQTPGPLWFKVLQTCERGSFDWSEVPPKGTSTAGLKTPAALLEVLSAHDFAQAQLLPKVDGAWVRSVVPGQQATGVFMKLTAQAPTRLVGAVTPVAGLAQVHQMTMEGEVMKMRPVGELDLPAGQTVELKPGGYHLMLQDLKQPVTEGSMVPLTLLFRNAKGVSSRMELKVSVTIRAPGGQSAASMDGHHH